MKLRIRTLVSFIALSLLLTGAPAYAGMMGVQMFVDGQLVATQTVEPDAGNAVPLEFEASDVGFRLEGRALLDVDPFIDYAFSVINFTENPLPFSLVFSSPYTLGPYDTLLTEFSSTVTDSDGNGGAAVAPTDASGLMALPFIDAANILAGALGGGCTPVMTPFDTVPCDPFSTATVSVVTLADGSFGVVVGFVLSGGDAMSGQGRVELLNEQVPEPASLLLLGLGVVIALGRRSSLRSPR